MRIRVRAFPGVARQRGLHLFCRVAVAGVAVAAVQQIQPGLAADCTAPAAEKFCALPGRLVPPAFLELAVPPPLSEPVQGPDFAPPAEAQPPLPLAVQKTDDKLSVRTGLSDVASYQGRELARKIEGIKTSLPPGMPVPRAAALPGSALDVWTGIEANGLAASSIASEPDAHLKTSVGADYKFFARSKAGIAIERSEAAEAALRAGRSQDEKISAYITLSAMPGVSLDTRAEWDKAAAAASEPSAAAKTSVSVAPRVGHSFAVGSGASLEPYVTMKHEIDVEDPAAARAPVATNSAGAGITLAKPDAFSLGLSTTLEHLSGGEPASVNSRLQLSVPLR